MELRFQLPDSIEPVDSACKVSHGDVDVVEPHGSGLTGEPLRGKTSARLALDLRVLIVVAKLAIGYLPAMTKPRNKRSNEPTPSLRNYLWPMLFSLAVGAAVTWLVMSQRAPSVVRPPGSIALPATQTTAPNASSPSSAEAAVGRANMAYDHQQWAEAIQEYQAAIANGLDNPDVRTDLGNAFRFSGQPEKALAQYLIAQRQNPQHENSLFNQIGLFMEVMHDPVRAIPACEDFIRRFPNSEKIGVVKQDLATLKNL